MKSEKSSLPSSSLTAVFIAPTSVWAKGPKPFSREPERVPSTSRTIPDDSFTVADLFYRVQRNQPLPHGLERPTSYGEQVSHADLDISKLSHLDLTQINHLKQLNLQQQKSLEERHQALSAAEAAKRERDQREREKINEAPKEGSKDAPKGAQSEGTSPKPQ